ncbi:hypothetical protein IVA98_33340 [Bradyrhizobium sp. 160]|uniref:hypothetical protein n=1 Tax=Bradyrhizobium sp. 160 TaxID=2782634 RepID=UPI001FF975BC|nr:hypothetical protein [Bradyrhizobium sp. 160]MCK1627904.1 hypothetical protein [Bradyrhizobium sp. 160]
MSFMMSSSADAVQDIDDVLIKLWRTRNVMLMNKSSVSRASGMILTAPNHLRFSVALASAGARVPPSLILRNLRGLGGRLDVDVSAGETWP